MGKRAAKAQSRYKNSIIQNPFRLVQKYTLDLYFSWGTLKKIFIGIYTIWHVEGIYVVLNLFPWIVWEVTGNLRHFTVPPCPEIFEAKTYTQK